MRGVPITPVSPFLQRMEMSGYNANQSTDECEKLREVLRMQTEEIEDMRAGVLQLTHKGSLTLPPIVPSTIDERD